MKRNQRNAGAGFARANQLGGILLMLLGMSAFFSCQSQHTAKSSRPNIIVFYVDDLGFADLGSYGGKDVSTPFLDSIAANGLRFTDAHSPASTCTPSRYSLLTGEYAFRHNAAILPGDAPLLIPEDKPTLAKLLKKAGYTTGVVGKWHLGLGNGAVDWNGDVKPGPLEIGFDYSFLLPSTGDRVPAVYLENHRVVNASPNDPIKVSYKQKLTGYPNGIDSPQLLRQTADVQHSNTIINGISRIGYMEGGRNALWRDEDFPMVFSDKANAFITRHKSKPFFLYFAFHDIHVPRVPHEQFAGKSPMGPRGDAIIQMDWTTKQILDHLKKLGLLENTMVIFTSDNGPVLDDGYGDRAVELVGNHKPGGPFRGGKYSAFEAGTRVPMLVYWKGKVSPGVSNALMSHIDFYRSFASLTNQDVPLEEAIDSENHLDALLGKSQQGREWMLEESYTFSVRYGKWKYIAPLDAKTKIPDWMANKGIESGLAKAPQLYNLDTDAGEKQNVAAANADLLTTMEAYLKNIMVKKNSLAAAAKE